MPASCWPRPCCVVSRQSVSDERRVVYRDEALMLVLPRREVDLGWASQNGELAAIGVLLGWTGGTPEMLVSTAASAA